MWLKEVVYPDGTVEVVPSDTVQEDRWHLRTEIKGHLVSTVFLSTEHSGGPYETMVFKGESRRELDFDRYESRKEAIEGHEQIVARWREKLSHEPDWNKDFNPIWGK